VSVRVELLRKAIHVALGGAALGLRWLTPIEVAILALAALAFNLVLVHRVTGGSLLRAGERSTRFSWGIVLYPAVVAGLVLVFHDRMEIVAGAWAILAFGDGMATVAGVLVGGPRLSWNPQKTWAGSVAFVLYGTATAAFLVRWTQQAVVDAALDGTAGEVPTWIGDSFLAVGASGHATAAGFLVASCAAAALVAAAAESASTRVDDNLTVGIAGGAALWLASLVEPALVARAAPSVAIGVLAGAALNAILAAAALAIHGVSRSGAWAGWLAGTLLFATGGWRSFTLLALLFALGTACTRIGWSTKAARGLAERDGGRRGAGSALANTTAGVGFAFLALATPYAAAMLAGLAAAFATAAADTVASEIGQAHGRRHWLVTSLRAVPPGTEGAVSIPGTLAGLAASVIVAAVAWTVGLVSPIGIAVVAAAAAFGMTLESVVAATLAPRLAIGHHQLNFASTLAGGIAAAVVLHGLR
jgi:uncharacterized protein (TIGR00297 family)